MVTASKLERERIDKLKKLSPKEADEYIESLVLDMYKGYHDGIIDVEYDIKEFVDKLDEFRDISLSQFPETNNVNAVINDRKMRYLSIAYLSGFYRLECYQNRVISIISFHHDMLMLENYLFRLKEMLMIYYDNYSTYGVIADLFMDLSDDGLPITFTINDKYSSSKKYGLNKQLMEYLDIKIRVTVESVMEKLDDMDKSFLIGDDGKFDSIMDELVDNIHDNIKDFYEKSYNDFEISAYKQSGMLDAQFEAISDIKENSNKQKKEYLEIKDRIMDLINGNGFGELSAKKFDDYKKDYPDADFDEWIKREPKYDVKNAKFIYPENSRYW